MGDESRLYYSNFRLDCGCGSIPETFNVRAVSKTFQKFRSYAWNRAWNQFFRRTRDIVSIHKDRDSHFISVLRSSPLCSRSVAPSFLAGRGALRPCAPQVQLNIARAPTSPPSYPDTAPGPSCSRRDQKDCPHPTKTAENGSPPDPHRPHPQSQSGLRR